MATWRPTEGVGLGTQAALFERHGAVASAEYRAHARSLVFNLKANPQLRDAALRDTLAAVGLVAKPVQVRCVFFDKGRGAGGRVVAGARAFTQSVQDSLRCRQCVANAHVQTCL